MKKTKADLVDALGRFGYPLLQPEAQVDPNELLAALSENGDPQLLEGFPVVLANCLAVQGSSLDLDKAEALLEGAEAKERFWQLVGLSRDLFDLYKLDFSNLEALSKHWLRLPADSRVRNRLVDEQPLKLGDREIHPDRLKRAFLNFLVQSEARRERAGAEKTQQTEGLRREYYMSLLFSPRQKDLVYKRLRGDPMTKTEREYFSRVIKKKLTALADPDLHHLAQKALQ